MIQFIETAMDLVNRYYIWAYAVCAVIILAYLRIFIMAGRERGSTIFSLEREIGASRQARALWAIGGVLAIMVAIAAVRLYVFPSIDLEEIVESTTPTPFAFFPTTEPPTPTPTLATPTPTKRVLPTLRRSTATPIPEPTEPPVPPCPNSDARITYPFSGMPVKGAVEVRGTANTADFQFYKVEYGVGEKPDHWSAVSDVIRQRVVDGILDTWDTTSFPEGAYVIRLTVVDSTGNFPPPCEVRVVVQN
jgi:hypothetical protein